MAFYVRNSFLISRKNYLFITLFCFGMISTVSAQDENVFMKGAEDYDEITAGSGSKAGDKWVLANDIANYVGDGFMRADMNQGDGDTNSAEQYSARITYNIDFEQAGTYYLWARIMFFDGSSDSFFYGINGDIIDRLDGATYDQWVWEPGNQEVTISSAGTYTLDIIQREPDALIDHIIVTMNASYDPELDDSWQEQSDPVAVEGLIITELMASNANTLYDPQYYNFSDWVEVYNDSDSAILLSNCFLSDDESNLKNSRLPVVSLEPGQYYLIYCDKESSVGHANFGISSEGETLYLSDGAGNVLDKVKFKEQYTDISYGRNAEDEWVYCINPTPGKANDELSGDGQAKKVKFDVDAGAYSSTATINLSGEDIRYTLDGSEPTSESATYSEAITVSSTKVIKTKSFDSDKLPSKTTANTYFINEHEFTLPVISLSFNPEYFYDPVIGIHVEGTNGSTGNCGSVANWNQNWERAAFLEYFDANGEKQISQSIGIKIGGGCTRGRDQKSLSLYARDKYGDGDFDYKFFAHKPYINHESSLLLRNSGNDQDLTLLRDAFIQELVRYAVDIDCQSYQPTAVYLNGDYHGVMNLREKLDEDYFDANYHIKSSEVDFLERNLMIIRGSADAATNLLSFAEGNDIASDEVYKQVSEEIDINSFIDYFAIELYMGNTDWPGNNLKFWKPKNYGKWRWILFDTDYGFGFRRTAPDVGLFDAMSGRGDYSVSLFNRLMENPDFEEAFQKRIVTLMHTVFSPDNCDLILDSMSSVIDQEIRYNQAEFGRTYQNWLDQLEILRKQTHDRYRFMLSEVPGTLNLSNPVNITIDNDSPQQGKVKLNGVTIQNYPVSVTTDQSLSAEIEAIPEKGYEFDHWESTGYTEYVQVLPLGDTWKYLDGATAYPSNWNQTTFDDSSWSSGQAQLGYGDGDENTVISYGGNGSSKIPTYLFRKTINITDVDQLENLQLGLVADDGGIVYINGQEVFRNNMNSVTASFSDYAAGTVRGENSVVSTDLDASVLVEGENVIAVEVHQASGTSSDVSFDLNMSYSITHDAESTELGTSRVLAFANSSDLGIVPVFKSTAGLNGIYINEIASEGKELTDEYGEDTGYIELYNPSDVDAVLYGFFLSDDDDNYQRFSIPDSTVIPAKGFLLFYTDGNTLQGPNHTNFELNEDGDEVYLYQMVSTDFLEVDKVEIDDLPKGFSYGRFTDGTGALQHMNQTPGAANDGEAVDIGAVSAPMNKTLNIYPNPTIGTVTIDIPNTSQRICIRVLDFAGKEILPEVWLNQSDNQLNLSNQQNGFYFLQVYADGELMKTHKLVLK